MGDLPVPPTDKFPIQITGNPKDEERKILVLYKKLRSQIMNQYITAKGKKRMRTDFKNQLENIDTIRRDTKI